MPTEARGFGAPETEVGSYLTWILEIKLQSARAISVLDQ